MNQNKVIAFLLVTFTLSLLFGLPAAMAIDPCQVIIYEHNDFGGASSLLISSDPELGDDPVSGGSWHDRISSIKVFGGAKAILYEHANYGGKSITFTGNDSQLSNNQLQPFILFKQEEKDWNDQATSIKVFCPVSSVSTTSLNYGNLYHSSRTGASTYNSAQSRNSKSFTLSNTQTESGINLDWELTGKPSYATVSATSGSINASGSTTITVTINPTSNVSTSLSLDTDSSDYTVSLTDINRNR